MPDDLATLEALVKARLPERHLLDVLKNVQYWVGYTRHFGPPSGADPKLADPVLRYIFTVFGYACELGASQTARHTTNPISRQILRRLNAQHITTAKLEAALRDVIAEYTRFELPFLWGSGQAPLRMAPILPSWRIICWGRIMSATAALGALPIITSVIRISPSLATSSRAGVGSGLYPGWLAQKSVRPASPHAVCRYPWAG